MLKEHEQAVLSAEIFGGEGGLPVFFGSPEPGYGRAATGDDDVLS